MVISNNSFSELNAQNAIYTQANQLMGGITTGGSGTSYNTLPHTLVPIVTTGATGGRKWYFHKVPWYFAAMNKIKKKHPEEIKDTAYFFRKVHSDDVIEAMDRRPTYRDKPRPWTFYFLNSIPAPHVPRGKSGMFYHIGFQNGLFYKLPPVEGKARTAYRATGAALFFIEHLAEKYPGFKKFADAYITKKNREEIIADTIALSMGDIPKSIQERIDKQAAIYRKRAEEEVKGLVDKKVGTSMVNWRNNHVETETGWDVIDVKDLNGGTVCVRNHHSSTVRLMRDGKVIAEMSDSDLMQFHDALDRLYREEQHKAKMREAQWVADIGAHTTAAPVFMGQTPTTTSTSAMADLVTKARNIMGL